MRKTLSLVLILILFSCKHTEKEKQLLQKEVELTQKENKLESENNKLEEKETQIKLNSEVENNIIYCESDKFIVKIDRLKNEDIRYTSWNKPKTITDQPNLVLYNGKVEIQGTGGGDHYFFKSGEWDYIVENNLMGETMESMGIFLKLLNTGEQKMYKKMTDLTTKDNYGLTSHSKNYKECIDLTTTEFKHSEVPYNKRTNIQTVQYNTLNCKINGVSKWRCDEENLRFIPILKKEDIYLILVPADCGDFSYRYYLLTVKEDSIVSNLYVEGEWYEPGNDDFIETTFFEINLDYTITVSTENLLGEPGKNEIKNYKITKEGNIVDSF